MTESPRSVPPDPTAVLTEIARLSAGAGAALRRDRQAAVDALYRAAALMRAHPGPVPPDQERPWLAVGYGLACCGDRPAAIAAYASVLRLMPDSRIGLFNLAVELAADGCHAAAAVQFDKLLARDPNNVAALFGLARARHAQGDLARAVPLYRAVVDREPGYWQGGCNLLLALVQQGALDPAALLAESRAWAARLARVPPAAAARPAPPAVHPPRSGPGRSSPGRLTVGLVSPDLRDHPVARFLEPVLMAIDRDRFCLVAYNSNAGGDAHTDRLRTRFDCWRDLAGLDDAAAEAVVRGDRPDILIDLAGHSANNRLPLFARRPAPIQASWLGYPATTGLDAIDYRLTDGIADPPGTDAWFSESLVRLRRFLCFAPPAESPPVVPPPAAAGAPVTFVSFNSLAKLSDRTVRLWAAVLAAVPDARLLLKAHALTDQAAADLMRRRFAAAGTNPDRLLMRQPTAGLADHLSAYGEADIALDPVPYNGTTTTCEALWMGVPVVTLAGQCHVDRVGAALLTHAGQPGTIAQTSEAFVGIAAALAADRSGLAGRRRHQRDRLRAAPLCDIDDFTRDLETALAGLDRRSSPGAPGVVAPDPGDSKNQPGHKPAGPWTG